MGATPDSTAIGTDMGSSQVRTMVIPSEVTQIPVVQQAVLAELEERGYSQRCVFAVRLALEEALTNAIRHGNADDPAKQVHVEYSIDDEQVRISICDQGPGFCPTDLPDPTCEENLTRPGGRGVLLIKSYMNDVRFNNAGNCLTMIKRRDEEPPAADQAQAEG